MPGWLPRFWPALALVALALALRCYSLTAPLLDYHSWRQADTAAIARNYAANGYHLLYPQVDWGGQTPGYVESEFPLYSYTLALLYAIFGIHEWLGRLLSALAGAVAVAALYGLVRSGSSHTSGNQPQVALYAGVVLALMPFPIYFGRTVMPDTWMLLTAVLAIWTFRRWLVRPSSERFGAALLCGALAPLAKTPNLLIVAVPIAYLVIADWARRRAEPAHPLRGRHIRLLMLYSACFIVPSLLWMRHAHTLPLDPRLSFGIGEKLFDLGLLLDLQFYLLLARWSVEHVLTWAGLPFFQLGLAPTTDDGGWRMQDGGWKIAGHRSSILDPRSSILNPLTHSPAHPFGLLPHFWLLGVFIFVLAAAAGLVGQDYYILPLAAPAAWLIGSGLDRAQRFLEQGEKRRSSIRDPRSSIFYPQPWIARLVPIATLVTLATLSLAHIAPLYRTTDFYRTLGQRVDLALPAGARVGMIAPAVSEMLYYGARKGWRLDPGVIVPGGLASLPPDLGVRYLLVADPELTEGRSVLDVALREYRRIPVGPYALLLDLARPGVQPPVQMIWETSHLLEEPFLSYWQASGGVELLGYPISDALDQPEGRVQFFEHALLLQRGDRVERLPVGRLLLEAQRRAAWPAQIGGPFQAAWERAGGTGVLGPALSPVLDDGAGGQIQYFEFGVLEAPRGSAPTPGAAGRQLLAARGLIEERQIELLRGW
jgi:4-amino-4-deoxy-L-arabinose transferase-like glycosyltransferase